MRLAKGVRVCVHMCVCVSCSQIRDVDSSRGPSDVRVFATLIESAQLYQRGKEVDAYDRHAYNSEYQFVRVSQAYILCCPRLSCPGTALHMYHVLPRAYLHAPWHRW